MYFIAAGEVEVDLPGQEGAARRRRVLRRDGAARQQPALRQYHHHAAVEAAGARSRRLPPADGAPSRSRRKPSTPRPSGARWRTSDATRQAEAARGGEHAGASTVDGARATIRLNRPRHLNRLQAEDLEALLQAVRPDRGRSRDPRAGADRHRARLLAPATISTRSPNARPARPKSRPRASAFEVMVNRLEDLGVPTICRLNGGVYGGSTDLALACDFRIGVDTAEMFMPAARLGLHYYTSGIRRYVSRLGVDNAKKLFLTAREDRRAGDAADRLSHRHGAGGGAGRGGRPAGDDARRQRAGRDARHEAHHQRDRARQARRGGRRRAAPATACAAPRSRKASGPSPRSGRRSFELRIIVMSGLAPGYVIFRARDASGRPG